MDSIQGSNLFILVIVAFVLSVLVTDDQKPTTALTTNNLDNNLIAEQVSSD